jgi:RNA polymerase sigma-70 factor (ECF subfamily)
MEKRAAPIPVPPAASRTEPQRNPNQHQFDIHRFIDFKVAQLITQYGFVEADREDLRQELLLDLVRRLPNYDATKSGARTFAFRLVNNRIASIIRERKAARRDYRRKAERPGDDDSVGELCIDGVQDFEIEVGLQIDVRRVCRNLEPNLAVVVAHVRDSESLIEVASLLSFSRSTLYKRLGRLRAIFASAGLDQYVNCKLPESHSARLE